MGRRPDGSTEPCVPDTHGSKAAVHGCGLPPSASASWSWTDCLFGAVRLMWILPVLPLLLVLGIACTLLEGAAYAISTLCGIVDRPPTLCGDVPLIVLPGTCTWVFYQIGAVQYLAEHYDLRGVRIAGVSSGAICAAVVLLLERCSSRAEVRARAHDLFALIDAQLEPMTRTPLSFVGRLGELVDALLPAALPDHPEVAETLSSGRIRVGMRRWRAWPVPHPHCEVVDCFSSRLDFINAVSASSTLAVMVNRDRVARRYRAGWCCDGVNPFSLWSVAEYARQLASGTARLTAPPQACNGGSSRLPWHRLHAIWNVEPMAALLPHDGLHVWVSPTVSGAIRLRWLLLVSGPWARELWRAGYDDARKLDADGYFGPLRSRRREECTATGLAPTHTSHT